MTVMRGVSEYAEGYPVQLETRQGRLAVLAINQGGHDGTAVDLVELLAWVKDNMPELLLDEERQI
jgi:hypothetical protein